MEWLVAIPQNFPSLWALVWNVVKIVALVLPLMICVAYLTRWER